jgi:non-heme chloroperoxidase
MDQLDLKNTVLVGHSTGGGEVTRYIGRHGPKRVAKAVLISAIPRLLLKTRANPGEFRQKCGMASAPVSLRILPSSTKTSLFSSIEPTGREPKCRRACSIRLATEHAGRREDVYECIKALSETDFTEDLKRFDCPDPVAPWRRRPSRACGEHGEKSEKLIKDVKAIYYPGAAHGIAATHIDEANADLLAFLQKGRKSSKAA